MAYLLINNETKNNVLSQISNSNKNIFMKKNQIKKKTKLFITMTYMKKYS